MLPVDLRNNPSNPSNSHPRSRRKTKNNRCFFVDGFQTYKLTTSGFLETPESLLYQAQWMWWINIESLAGSITQYDQNLELQIGDTTTFHHQLSAECVGHVILLFTGLNWLQKGFICNFGMYLQISFKTDDLFHKEYQGVIFGEPATLESRRLTHKGLLRATFSRMACKV